MHLSKTFCLEVALNKTFNNGSQPYVYNYFFFKICHDLLKRTTQDFYKNLEVWFFEADTLLDKYIYDVWQQQRSDNPFQNSLGVVAFTAINTGI